MIEARKMSCWRNQVIVEAPTTRRQVTVKLTTPPLRQGLVLPQHCLPQPTPLSTKSPYPIPKIHESILQYRQFLNHPLLHWEMQEEPSHLGGRKLRNHPHLLQFLNPQSWDIRSVSGSELWQKAVMPAGARRPLRDCSMRIWILERLTWMVLGACLITSAREKARSAQCKKARVWQEHKARYVRIDCYHPCL